MDISSRLDFDSLRAVVTLEQTRNFTVAGHMLGISQSSLSRKVSSVERVLNVRLFNRTTRSVSPTLAGEEILVRFRGLVDQYEAGMEGLARHLRGEAGKVTIGCLPSIAATYLPSAISAFVGKYPDVQLVVRDALLDQAVREIHNGAVDFAVMASGVRFPGLFHYSLGMDPFLCAVPQGHPFAEREVIDWADFHGESFIGFSSESSIRQPVDLALSAAGAVPSMVTRAGSTGSVAGLVASGMGITAIPQLVCPLMDFAKLVYVPLVPTVEREKCVVFRNYGDISAPARHFIEIILERQLRSEDEGVERPSA